VRTLPKYQKRLKEALVYFSGSVEHPTKIVMYKMLATLDYRHYAKTGLPVTSLEYETWDMGDVPAEFHREITKGRDTVLPDYLKDSLNISKVSFELENGEEGVEFGFSPKRGRVFNPMVFTPRQLKILSDVVDIFKEVPAWMASQASHERGTPWYRAMKADGKGKPIDLAKYADLDNSVNFELAKEKLREMRAFVDNYGNG
jgi:hypothetical protein